MSGTDGPRDRLKLRGSVSLDRPQESGGRAFGPSPRTRRDLNRPYRWLGLSARDCRLLEEWLPTLDPQPDELHTHVPVGSIPKLDELRDSAFNRKQLESLWPRRIDAVLRFGETWWIIECKPDANHYVVGQVLCYRHWWLRDCGELKLARCVVLTDRCDPDVEPVLKEHQVEVVALAADL